MRTNVQVTSRNLIEISGKQRRAVNCNVKTLNRIPTTATRPRIHQ